jgi:hypothetical protein
MQTRLDRMIQDCLEATSQPETQQLLATHLSQLDPPRTHQSWNPDDDPDFALSQWRQQWCETSDSEHLAVSGTDGHHGATFPASPILPQPSPLPGLADAPRRDHSGRVADRPDPLTLHPEAPHEYSPFNRRTESASADAYDIQPRQVAYVPKSKGPSTQTLIPFNMASAAQVALDL